MKTVIIAFDEFTDIDVFLMWDLLNRAVEPGFEVRLLGDREHHVSRTGISVRMQGNVREANSADVVLFASGPGTRKKIRDEEYLRGFRLDPERQRIGSICSGALILAALGLLDGKRATTHPATRELLAQFPVRIVDEPFVREGNVATAGGCLAAQYLVSWVLKESFGAAVRDRVLAEIQPVGTSAPHDLP